MNALCVYCGSSSGADGAYRQAAAELGRSLARAGRTVVYGGGNVGLMGALADAALAAGGRVIGVIPCSLADRELGHLGLTELHVVATMHERKAMMADLADAFVALPGGIGTLEEFFEAWTWGQLGLHAKPCGLLNVAGYFDPLLAFLGRMVDDRFIRPGHMEMICVAQTPADLLARLESFRPPDLPKWIDP
ncbi:MAG: LOG family protein YvdD [Phycisphaerae bacterium]|nr:LOG family protein YvdD [Phycisphaerae bacterium]